MTDLYSQIARTSGVDRDIVKRVLAAHAYSGGPPLPPKFPDSDAAVQIAEEAFCAGYDSAAQRAVAFHPTKITDWAAHRHQAWSEFEPSEDVKDLVK